MNVEQTLPPISTWRHVSSPVLRAEGRSVEGSSNSVGRSSLDTASASPNLERYEASWSFESLIAAKYRLQPPSRQRAYTSTSGGLTIEYNRRLQFKNVRPLAGASRRRLVSRIEELTASKAELQARLEAMSSYISAARSNQQFKEVKPMLLSSKSGGSNESGGIEGLDESVDSGDRAQINKMKGRAEIAAQDGIKKAKSSSSAQSS